jgi:hypothetical protein
MISDSLLRFLGNLRKKASKAVDFFVQCIREFAYNTLIPCRFSVHQGFCQETGSHQTASSATEYLSLAIFHKNHQIARGNALICNHVVAEKGISRPVTRNSQLKSRLANSARPFGRIRKGVETKEEAGL